MPARTGGEPPALIIDVGSSAVKAALATGPDDIRELQTIAAPPASASGSRHETPAEAFLDIVERLVDRATGVCGALAGIGFSTQMQGVLVTDAQDRPLSPFLSWQDERALEVTPRGSRFIDDVAQRVAPAIIEAGGVRPRAGLGVWNLARWRTENAVPAASRVHTLGSFLLARLTGSHLTHVTSAASIGAVDLRAGGWNRPLLAALGLDDLSFPGIVEDFVPVGTWGGSVPVHPDIGDHQASLRGSGLRAGEVALSVGTAGIAATVTDRFDLDEGVEVRPYVDGSLLRTVSRLPGGRQLRSLFDAYRSFADLAGIRIGEQEFWTAVGAAPASGGLLARTARSFLDGYVRAYDDALSVLFRGGARPVAARLNGGAARHIPWFRESFAGELGLTAIEAPEGDLAVRGVVMLMDDAGGVGRKG